VTIRILPRNEAETGVWATALDLATIFADLPWLLVGAQMVVLLEHEAGRPSSRATADIDAMVDVRAVTGGVKHAARRLLIAGFEPDAQHGYRFVRGAAQVDLLAPDHLGPRADLTTIPPATTAAIAGGTRALEVARVLEVSVDGVGIGALPVPSLTGAIILKVSAWHGRKATRDLEDLVRLFDLVGDVEAARHELKRTERRSLAAVAPLLRPEHPAWRVARDRGEARAAFLRLSE